MPCVVPFVNEDCRQAAADQLAKARRIQTSIDHAVGRRVVDFWLPSLAELASGMEPIAVHVAGEFVELTSLESPAVEIERVLLEIADRCTRAAAVLKGGAA